MAALPPEELLRLWRQEAISVEMAIGHITQNLVKLQDYLDAQRQLLQASLEAQRQTLAGIQASLPPLAHAPPAKSKRRKPS
jgi:hypothetical protein